MTKTSKVCERISRKVRFECRQSNKVYVLIGAAAMFVTFVTVRLISGSPYYALRILGIGKYLLPIWLVTLTFALGSALSGAALGTVLGRRCGREAEKYRGGMFFVLMAVFGFLWYPLIFSGMAVFSGLIMLALAIFLGILCGVNFYKVSRLAAMQIFAWTLWLVYLFCSTFLLLISV